MVSKLITSKEQILVKYSDVFDGIRCLPGPPYCIQVDIVPHLSKPHVDQSLYISKVFQERDWQHITSGSLKPVNHTTNWINSLVLVRGKDKLGNIKLRICLDPTNLHKAIVHEPYHFKTPEDIAHFLVEASVITVCDCRKGYQHQQLDETSSFLTKFNTELARF